MRPTSNGKTTCVERLCVGNAAPCLWHSGPGSLELESILMIDLTSDFFHPRKICSVYLITPSHGERLPFQKKWKIYEDLFRLRFSTKIEKGPCSTNS